MQIIRVVDLETTGFEPPEHKVIEIGYCDVGATTTNLAGEIYDFEVLDDGLGVLVDPKRSIPPESSAIHHLISDDLKGARSWEAAAKYILREYIPHEDDCIAYAAHNAKFEKQWCEEFTDPLPWICTYKSALRLWPHAPAHSNQALRYWKEPQGLDRMTASQTHRAFPDAYVTAFLLRDMLNEGATMEQLIRWSNEPALQIRCHIGKWRGTPWREVDDGFLQWVSERDFDEDVLFTVRHEMDRREELSKQIGEESNAL